METTQVQTKRSIIMNPVVSYAVILFFLWVAFNNIHAYLAGAHYRHMIAFVFSILIVSNRILWLPQMVTLVERYEVIKMARSFMPLVILVLVGAFVFLKPAV